jgi:hypothetical protein
LAQDIDFDFGIEKHCKKFGLILKNFIEKEQNIKKDYCHKDFMKVRHGEPYINVGLVSL